ncbi:MAG: hypothetical protein GXO08_02205 [Aquificae bacterium]|nr:hypothetical protein [Aquificota bacterium]
MAAVVFTVEGTTKDGKKARVTVTLKKFCACKPTHPNCQEEAQRDLVPKVQKVLAEFSSDELFWLEGKVNPNFFVRVMEMVTEVLEAVCITVRSDHLQGADVKVELL